MFSRGISLLLHHRPFFNIFDAGERKRISLLLLTKCDRSTRFSFLSSSLALGTTPPHCIEGLLKGLGLGLRVSGSLCFCVQVRGMVSLLFFFVILLRVEMFLKLSRLCTAVPRDLFAGFRYGFRYVRKAELS